MADFNIRFWHRVADEQPFIGQVQCRFGYVPNRSKLLKILAVRKRQHGHAQWCAAYAARAQRLLHLVFQEAGKRRIGTEEPEIAGIQQQFHVDCRLLRRIFQARPLLTTVAVAHVYATVQLQQGYVPEGEAGTLCIENPFDVSVPIGRDDRHLERPAQSDYETGGVVVRETFGFPKPAEDTMDGHFMYRTEFRRVIIWTKIVARIHCHVDLCEVIFEGWFPHTRPPRKDSFPELSDRRGYELFNADVPAPCRRF